MSLIEEMIFNIDYLLEHVFDDVVHQIQNNSGTSLNCNPHDEELFNLYTTFVAKNYFNIFNKNEFTETRILNYFQEYKDKFVYCNKPYGATYYIEFKEVLLNIRNILYPLYVKMKNNNSI